VKILRRRLNARVRQPRGECVIDPNQDREALGWQTGIWNRISDIYVHEIDRRFVPVVEALVGRATLVGGEHVLDLGTGTGAVAQRAAAMVGPHGRVVGVDISPEMLERARRRATSVDLGKVTFLEGRAEAIPAEDAAFSVVLACLSMMYVIDRDAAAREIARVLKPAGQFVAAVWAGPEECDIVLFQQTAGRFAGTPPMPGIGPGALAEPSTFLRQLDAAGIQARVETETLGFDFPNFTAAWNTLAGVTTAQLPPERRQEAEDAVMAAMYPQGDGPRHFRNVTHFIVGRARA
jgi:SAM-dependent methyltransferase